MAITVTWSVLDMKRDAATGGVKEVRWQCAAEADTGESAVEAGKFTCTPDPDAADFVAYEDLTEAVVLGWVKDALDAAAAAENSDTKSSAAIEAARTAKVEARLARDAATASGMPWAPVEPAE
jgi:hypothetical protein